MLSAAVSARVFVIVAVLAIVGGIALRLGGLETKIYGSDETTTALRASGHSIRDYETALFDGRHRSIGDFQRFQAFDPATTDSATVHSLIVEDPQHPPLYYLLERWSERAIGSSISARRWISAACSVAAIFAALWLGIELFGSVSGGLCLAALIAASPFHFAYAQQAREYSMWAMWTLVATALLLFAIRRRQTVWWLAYTAVLVAGLYTYPFFVATMIAHAGYIVFVVRRPNPVAAFRCFWANMAALVLFMPWLAVMIVNRRVIADTTTWLAAALPAKVMLSKWAFETSAVFFDAEYALPILTPIALLGIIIAVYAMVALCRAREQAAALVVPLVAASAAALVVPDLLLHQSHSVASRYLTTTWIGLELAVAWALTRPHGRTVRLAGFIALVACGIGSEVDSSRAPAWWLDTNDAPLKPIAAQIARSLNPAIVFSGDSFYVLELSNLLPRAVGVRVSRGRPVVAPNETAFAVGTEDEIRAGFGRLPTRVAIDAPVPAGAKLSRRNGQQFTISLWRPPPRW